MNQHRKILNQISAIRSSHSQMTNIFLYGSCLNLFCILRSIYPEAQPWYNVDHVITEIGGRFYDITGSVSNEGYLHFTEVYDTNGRKRAYYEMVRSEFPLNPLK